MKNTISYCGSREYGGGRIYQRALQGNRAAYLLNLLWVPQIIAEAVHKRKVNHSCRCTHQILEFPCGEVLKLMPKDVSDQKLTIQSPTSGKHAEVVFIPRTVVERLRAYIKERAVEAESRIFPITYSAARIVVKKAGRLAGIELRPHDLRRRAATDASRSGVPIETISKVSLRHSNLATTQRYLGEISETEAASWIENLYGIKKAFRVPPPQSKHTVPWLTWIERLRGLVADMEL